MPRAFEPLRARLCGMLWFNRRFSRLRLALSQTLARVIERHEPPEPPGRDAWLSAARSTDDLWRGVKSPIWAVHLAHHIGRKPAPMMDVGTELLASSLRGHLDSLPTVLDFSTVEPEERALDTYFDWEDQPLEDLADGSERYEAAALEQLTRIAALAESGPETSPYRGSSGWPNDLAPGLHRLVAVKHWFSAARHASESEPERPAMRDALGLALAHAFAAQPSQADALLQRLVVAYRRGPFES